MKPSIKNTYNLQLLIFCIFALVGINNANSQCPTITNNTQSFCDLDEPTVADLIATDAGNGIVWYETATSTTPLDLTDGLENGEDYFADDTTGSCGIRESVTITIYGAPTGFNFQGVCVEDPNEATISDLEAFGNDVQWYDISEGGTPLDDTTLLRDETIYYADQANPDTGCRTSRLSVLVNVGVVPVPTGNPIQEFCSSDIPTVADLAASGNNNWYDSLSSVVPLEPTTPLVDGQSYFATTVDPPCESNMRFEVTVQLSLAPDPGISNNLDICTTGSPQDLFTILGGTPETGGTWSPALASGSGIFDPTVDAAGTYTYTVGGIPPCNDASATVTVTILLEPDAGTNGSLDFCSNDAAQDLFSALGGTPDTGGTWSPVLASGTGIFDPTIDTAGIYTYTVSGAPCDEASAEVTVGIIPEANPGTNGILDICNYDTPVDLLSALGGTPENGGTWSPTLVSGTGIFDPSVDLAGIYTYTVNGIAPCGNAAATVTVTILPQPNAGLDGSLEICSNDGPQDLFSVLGGTPETGGVWSPALISGTGIFDPSIDAAGIYTYTLSGPPPCGDATANVTVTIIPEANPGINSNLTLCSNGATQDLFTVLGGTPDSGGTWSPALTSGTGVFDPTIDAAGTYTYTVSGIAPCADASATVTVIIAPEPNAGLDGAINICSIDNTQDLFTALDGTPEVGGTWSPVLASGTGVFNPATDTAGVYTYTVNGTPPCGSATATVTVSITLAPNPGTNGNLDICNNDSPQDLFSSLGGIPDIGGTWSPALASGTGVFDPTVDTAGTYTYTLSGTSPCGDATATVTVVIVPEPDAGIDGTINICSIDNTQDLISGLGGTPDTGGTWSPLLASGTGVFDPAIDTAGTYTYTVNGNPPCGNDSATVTVSITIAPNPGTNGSLDICNNDSPQDLFTILGGTPETGGTWSPALASGTGVFDPAIDAAGTYTYTLSGTSPCGDISATVSVSVIPEPNAGIDSSGNVCIDDGPQDLLNLLDGSPDPGGTWSPTLNSGTGVFDPTSDSAGVYTYTVTGPAQCGQTATASLTVTISENPNLSRMILELNSICLGENNAVTFSNATLVPDGDYMLTYLLSGANDIEQTIEVNFIGGESSFEIPASILINSGITTLTLTDFFSSTTLCGADATVIDPINFTVFDSPTPSLVEDGNIFCSSDNATIGDLSANIIESGTIIWYDAQSNGNAYDDGHFIENGATYYASLSTADGCTSLVRLAVTITIDICEEFLIPDGFSPNGDGINDTFFIPNLRVLYPDFHLEIYNRYGNVLYKGNKNNVDWDGRNNGNSEAPVGVYFYILKFNDGARDPIQGRVYLSR